MIKAMIVDDKTAAIELLRWLIKEHCPEITSVASALSVAEALPLIESYEPDILFLDIQLPQETGFDLLTKVRKWNFEVIFTTAFNEYAIQAIRFSALDYLLKPINGNDLRKAVERFKVKKESSVGGEEMYRNFIRNITRESDKPLKLALPGVSGIQYVLLEDIVRLQAERNYTRLYFVKGKNFLSSKTLAEYEKILRDAGFMRVHRSHLINPLHMERYERQGILRLKDGCEIEVSRRKKDAVISHFRSYGNMQG
ncbi:MAG TPA: LytTR family DNA-binding domain-containing protein [Chitinophagaceae bacterium]|nr:LytTR family DNA-binding domain-containing protein [Chitinophagaceae bacterium]